MLKSCVGNYYLIAGTKVQQSYTIFITLFNTESGTREKPKYEERVSAVKLASFDHANHTVMHRWM